MLKRMIAIVPISMALAVPASPCTVSSRLSPGELVRNAEVIVRVRVTGLAAPGPPRMFGGEEGRRVQFQVLETLKGTLPSSSLSFTGELEDHGDPNDADVPYNFVRPGGRRGNCYALGYRQGTEYLLMLRRPARPRADGSAGELTPYWAPLSPVNEQLGRGEDDPWLAWVRREADH